MDNSTSSSGGIGCATVLLIVFVVLKLTGLITWSWLWVLSPFWIPILIIVAICLFVIIGVGILYNILE